MNNGSYRTEPLTMDLSNYVTLKLALVPKFIISFTAKKREELVFPLMDRAEGLRHL